MCFVTLATLKDVPRLVELQKTSGLITFSSAQMERLIPWTLIHVCGNVITGFIQIGHCKNKLELLEPYSYKYKDMMCITVVTSFAVDAKYRGKGIGTQLLTSAHDMCLDPENLNSFNKYLLLNVRESNPARFLYDRFGFKTIGQLDNYYSDPTEHSIVKVFDVTSSKPNVDTSVCAEDVVLKTNVDGVLKTNVDVVLKTNVKDSSESSSSQQSSLSQSSNSSASSLPQSSSNSSTSS